jgi:hypothetical protein
LTQFSYPYDAGDGASINEDQWSFLAGSWQDNGVDCAGPWQNDLKVSSQAEDLTLSVAPGHAFIEGFHFHLTETTAVYFTANPTTSPRLDLVVLALDKTSNTISLEVKPGVPSTNPAPPALDSSRDTREIPLATIRVRPSSTTVLPAEVTDAREYRGRRIRVSDTPQRYEPGSIVYGPADQVWRGVRFDHSAITFADAAMLEALAGDLAALEDSVGDIIADTVSDLQTSITALQASITALTRPAPYCSLTTTNTYSGGVGTAVNWTIEVADNAAMWSPANPSRVIAPRDGIYHLHLDARLSGGGSSAATLTTWFSSNALTASGNANDGQAIGQSTHQVENGSFYSTNAASTAVLAAKAGEFFTAHIHPSGATGLPQRFIVAYLGPA